MLPLIGDKLRPLDHAMLGVFCANFEVWSVHGGDHERRREVHDATGFTRPNPLVAVANRAAAVMANFAAEGCGSFLSDEEVRR